MFLLITHLRSVSPIFVLKQKYWQLFIYCFFITGIALQKRCMSWRNCKQTDGQEASCTKTKQRRSTGTSNWFYGPILFVSKKVSIVYFLRTTCHVLLSVDWHILSQTEQKTIELKFNCFQRKLKWHHAFEYSTGILWEEQKYPSGAKLCCSFLFDDLNFFFDNLNCETTWKGRNLIRFIPLCCNPEQHWFGTEVSWFCLHVFVSFFRKNTTEHQNRVTDITEQIHKTGLYDMTYDELCFGAKTAWRNAPRCIGRIQWNNLKVDPLKCFLKVIFSFSSSKDN